MAKNAGIDARLKRLRAEKGWTMVRAVANIAISQSSLSEYERGEKEPRSSAVAALAKRYGVSADYLLGLKRGRA